MFITRNRRSAFIVYYSGCRDKLIIIDDREKKVIRREFNNIALEKESKSFLEVVYVV